MRDIEDYNITDTTEIITKNGEIKIVWHLSENREVFGRQYDSPDVKHRRHGGKKRFILYHDHLTTWKIEDLQEITFTLAKSGEAYKAIALKLYPVPP